MIGECSFPYGEPVIWSCEACLTRWPRERGHTVVQGECKWAVAGYRKKRTGHHPRDPAKPASEGPTAGLPGTNKGVELGADVEKP